MAETEAKLKKIEQENAHLIAESQAKEVREPNITNLKPKPTAGFPPLAYFFFPFSFLCVFCS